MLFCFVKGLFLFDVMLVYWCLLVLDCWFVVWLLSFVCVCLFVFVGLIVRCFLLVWHGLFCLFCLPWCLVVGACVCLLMFVARVCRFVFECVCFALV